MRRGLLLAVVTALMASAVPSPALAQETAQETPGEEEYCAVPTDTAYQYDCEGPQAPECVPQEQYAEDENSGCVAGPDQYGPCTASTPCDSEAHAQVQGDVSSGPLPPASVQNVVVEAARSVTKDAPEASRALDTAQPKDSADNVALAAEVETITEPPATKLPAEQPPADLPLTPEETVAEPPAHTREAPQGTTVESATAPPAAEVPRSTSAPADTAETPGIAEPVEVTKPTAEATESTEIVDEQEERGLEKADGEPVASHGLASVDQFMVPLFALGGSTLLVGGGLLVRRIVG